MTGSAATRASAHWANLFLLIASGGMVFVPAVSAVGGTWFPSDHRHVRETACEVLHELRGVRRPRTRRLATGLSVNQSADQ